MGHVRDWVLSITNSTLSAEATSSTIRRAIYGNQIEQDYAELEDSHPAVVDDVKLLSRKLKPTAMKPMHEVTGEDKEQKPD